jgi:thiol-disulfide isomerase/thioredoxin
MKLRDYFEKGLTLEEYSGLLGEQRALHELHFRRSRPSEEDLVKVRLTGPQRMLVITEPWCGDSLAILPVVIKLFQEAGNGEIRIVLRDQNPELIDRYLTHGGRAIPIVVFLDENFEKRFHWGPRPAQAQAIVEERREDLKQGRIARSEIIPQIRNFYSRDQGRAIVEELCRGLTASDRSQTD